jgi:hypothetical protein
MIYYFAGWGAFLARVARLCAIGLLMVLAGCVQRAPIAYYAHPGGTIILGLGGIQRNANGEQNLQANDLTITITDVNNNVTSLNANQVFKTFPDYSSGLTNISLSSQNTAGLIAFDGGWFASLTLPGTLAPGAYWISITSPKLINTNVSSVEGDLTQIPLQIEAIPSGLSRQYDSLNQTYNQQFTYYPTQVGRLDVSPNPAPASSAVVGGLQLVINFPTANYTGSPPILALPYSHHPSIQLAQNLVNNSNGTTSLVVLLSSSQGFASGANRTALMPQLSDLSLSFLFYRANGIVSSAAQQLADFQIDQSRSHYYDVNGNILSGMQPVMTFK